MKLHRHLWHLLQRRVAHRTQADAGDDGAPDRAHPLSGWIQLDEAYLGGERSGGKRGRGAPGKTCPLSPRPDQRCRDTRCAVKLTVVEGFRLTEIAAWAQLTPQGQLLGGLRWVACFNGVTAAGCVHQPVVCVAAESRGRAPRVSMGEYDSRQYQERLARHLPCDSVPSMRERYLSEFEYRFNRRFDLPDIIPRLVYVALSDAADADTATQVTLSLSGNQVRR